MRTFIYRLAWIVILLAIASSFAQADDFVFYNFKKKAVASAAPSFLFRETFDGASACGDGSHTNCDQTTWTCAGMYDLNKTDNVIQGTYDATFDNSAATCTATVTGHTGGKIYATAIIVPTGNGVDHGAPGDLALLQDNGTILGYARLVWATDHYNVRLYRNAGASNATCTTSILLNEKWYLKLEYTPGTGANGVWSLFVAKDAAGFPGWGSVCATSSVATDTANIGKLKVGVPATNSGIKIDDIRVNNADITYP